MMMARVSWRDLRLKKRFEGKFSSLSQITFLVWKLIRNTKDGDKTFNQTDLVKVTNQTAEATPFSWFLYSSFYMKSIASSIRMRLISRRRSTLEAHEKYFEPSKHFSYDDLCRNLN